MTAQAQRSRQPQATARRRLIAALIACQSARYGTARRLVDSVLAGPADGPLHLAAASVLYVTRDHDRALAIAAKAAQLDPSLAADATELRVTLAEPLGWDQEARVALEEAIAADPEDPRWPARMTRLMVRAGALEEALRYAERAVALEGRSPRMAMERARLLAALARHEEAIAAVREALALAPAGDPRYGRAAAEIFADAGAVAEAEATLRQARAAADDPAIDRRLAELALWRGDVEDAEARIAAADLDADARAWARPRGILLALAGAWEEARAAFDAVLADDPQDYVARTWRTEAAYRLGDLEAAEADVGQAIAGAPDYHPAAWILRFLIVVASEPALAESTLAEAGTAEFRPVVREVFADAAQLLAGCTRRELAARVDALLRRCLGNRSCALTYRGDDGALVRLRARAGVRYAARSALRQIRGRPPAAVLEALDAVIDDYPASALPICHRGELHFWLGDLERARADLNAALAINTHTRWAHIGLTGIEIAENAPARALETSARGVALMHNTEGPAVFVYRGEAERLLGDLEAARRDLETALAINDQRLGAWLNLALVCADLGDDAGFEAAWEHLEVAARGLLSDAALELGVPLWGDPGACASAATRVRAIRHALAMCRGNRSTGHTTYLTKSGRLRFVPPYVTPAMRAAEERQFLGIARHHLRARKRR
jgi:tetratricopeptide (TPR) repeat protein